MGNHCFSHAFSGDGPDAEPRAAAEAVEQGVRECLDAVITSVERADLAAPQKLLPQLVDADGGDAIALVSPTATAGDDGAAEGSGSDADDAEVLETLEEGGDSAVETMADDAAAATARCDGYSAVSASPLLHICNPQPASLTIAEPQEQC